MEKILKWFFPTPEPGEDVIRRELWTRDILRIMFSVVATAAALILIGSLAGLFDFIGTLPIYILLVLVTIAWIGTRNGLWRWTRFIPILLCYGMGIYYSLKSGFGTSGLFYALTILLTGTLISNKARGFTLILTIATSTLIGTEVSDFNIIDDIPAIITVIFLLTGISTLQGYYNNKVYKQLTDLYQSNRILNIEISRRQQAEAEKQTNENLYIRLAENTSDLVCEMAADGNMVYVSPSYRLVLGYEPESLLGTSAFSLVHPDDLPFVIEAQKIAISQHKPVTESIRIRHLIGHYLTMQIAGTPIFNGDGNLKSYVISSRDITQQTLAEEAIAESEAKYRTIIESIPMGVHLYEISDSNELMFIDSNPAADKILGIKHADLEGRTILEAFPALAGTEVPDKYYSLAKNGGQWKIEQITYKDDKIQGAFEVQAFQSSPNKVAATFSDITSRISSAESLRMSEEKFSKAFLTSPDSVNINRLVDGVYIDINQGFTNLTGFTREDVIGRSSLELDIWVNPADREKLVKGLRESGIVNNLEAEFRFKNGICRTGLMSASVIEINGEKCILSITRDITERKQAESELLIAHNQLEDAYNATLEGWVRALEIREHDTADHSRRVVDMTLHLATKMGISGEKLLQTRRGALLHDIGKMGVPDSILMKPGALTPEEWTIMRYHPLYAHNLLQDIAYLVPVMDIPYCHHERWDGSGYPRGLSGEDIPLPARIFAIVDVYDALLSNRPYRPAWSEKDVRSYLIEQKGRHFDPRIVDEFLDMINSGKLFTSPPDMV